MTGEPDTWERRQRQLHTALPYALLAFSLLVTVVVEWDAPERIAPVAGLSLVTGVWLLWWHTAHPAWRCVPWRMAVFFAGLLPLMAALVILAPWYGFFTFTGYLLVDDLPGRWRWAGVAAIATLTGTSQNGGPPGEDAGSIGIWLLLVAVNLAVGGGFMHFAFLNELQQRERQAAIRELTRVNARLEQTLRENAALQAQLVTHARESGVHDERQRMAREIHDTLAQGLIGIVTQLEAAEATPPGSDEDRRHREAAMRLARDSLDEARRSVQELRPEPLESAQLPDALATVARGWSELHGVEVRATTTGTPRPMRPEIEVALLRTAQEALANVAKHAGATRVGLTLSYMDEVVTLDVRDDGAGFDPARARNGGFGLTSMRERVHGLAGTLEIESERGRGTAISAAIPAVVAVES